MKKISIYTLVGIILVGFTLGILILEEIKLFGMSSIQQVIEHNESSRIPYLIFGLIASLVCLFYGLKYDIKESRRKEAEQAEFWEKEQFMEDFFDNNKSMFEEEDRERQNLKREVVIGMLQTFNKGRKIDIIFSLVHLIEKRDEEIKQLKNRGSQLEPDS